MTDPRPTRFTAAVRTVVRATAAVVAAILSMQLLAVGTAWLRAKSRGIGIEAAHAAATGDPWNLGFIQLVAFGLVTLLMTRIRAESPFPERIRFRPVTPATIFFAIVAGVALQAPIAELGTILERFFPVPFEDQAKLLRFLHPGNAALAMGAVFAVVVVAPLTEEALYRGSIQRELEPVAPNFAVFITAILFGMSHFGGASTITPAICAGVAGLALGRIARTTESIAASVAAHAAFNALPVLVPEHVVRLPGMNTLHETPEHVPLPLVIGGLIVAALAMTAIERQVQPRPPPQTVPPEDESGDESENPRDRHDDE